MAEPDLLLLAARTLGAHAETSYAVGLATVLLLTWAAWAALRRSRGSPAARRAGDPLPAPLNLVWCGGLGLALIITAAVVFAGIAEHIGPGGQIARADDVLATTLRAHLGLATLRFFALFTHAGDTAVLTLLGAGVALALWLAGQRLLVAGWVMAVGGNAVLNPLLKGIFERVRPVHDHGVTTETSWSFPSGHSSGSMVAYGMLGYLALRLLPERWHLPALLLAAALIFTTGSSRVLLQVHYASDVVAGFASGLAWLAACVLALEWRGHRDRAAGNARRR